MAARRLLSLCSVAFASATVPAAGTAQAIETIPRLVVFATDIALPAEGELIRCSQPPASNMPPIQYGGSGLQQRAGVQRDLFARRWRVDLVQSQRVVLLELEREERPRSIQVSAPRPAEAGGGTDGVFVRFDFVGQEINGYRIVEPPRASRRAARRNGESLRSKLGPEDAIIALGLARELAHRCANGIYEPLPIGAIWRRIPPP